MMSTMDAAEQLRTFMQARIAATLPGFYLNTIAKAIIDKLPAELCAFYSLSGEDDVAFIGGRVRAMSNDTVRPLTNNQRHALYLIAYDAFHMRKPHAIKGRGSWAYVALTIQHEPSKERGVIVIGRRNMLFHPADHEALDACIDICALALVDAAVWNNSENVAELLVDPSSSSANCTDTQPVSLVSQHETFLSEVAHKMRNRLNSIHGFIELVATGHAGRINTSQREMLSYAHTSSLDLIEYIEDLLYLTRASMGTIHLENDAVSVGDILDEVVQHVTLEVEVGELDLAVTLAPDLPVITADRARLRQVLLSLVLNAIKFTPAGGRISINVTQENPCLQITITDSGVGIAPEDLPHVFEPGYQSERMQSQGKSGGGMGLAAARSIVELHNGTLTIDSHVDGGTIVTVALPLTGMQ
jgi:signal transduction histidine kinase